MARDRIGRHPCGDLEQRGAALAHPRPPVVIPMARQLLALIVPQIQCPPRRHRGSLPYTPQNHTLALPILIVKTY